MVSLVVGWRMLVAEWKCYDEAIVLIHMRYDWWFRLGLVEEEMHDWIWDMFWSQNCFDSLMA